MVGDYRVDYLYSHTRVMVQEERRRDLSNLFVLLNGIPHALEPVILEFEDHVKCQGGEWLGNSLIHLYFDLCTLTFIGLTAFDKLQLDKVFGYTWGTSTTCTLKCGQMNTLAECIQTFRTQLSSPCLETRTHFRILGVGCTVHAFRQA